MRNIYKRQEKDNGYDKVEHDGNDHNNREYIGDNDDEKEHIPMKHATCCVFLRRKTFMISLGRRECFVVSLLSYSIREARCKELS